MPERTGIEIIKGIDVSKFQGRIRWKEVKRSKRHFAMIRAGYGTRRDRRFSRNIRSCNRLGIGAGVYWFSYALNEEEARREAQRCLRVIRHHRISWPVCYDLEYDSIRYAQSRGVRIDRELATKMAEAFLDEIQKNGYFAMLYSNQDFLDNMFEPRLLRKYSLWYARYASGRLPKEAGIWQYSSRGRVPGIRGAVDLDLSRYNYGIIIRRAGLNRL